MSNTAQPFGIATLLAAIVLVSGCASPGPADPETTAQYSPCPPDLTLSCIEYNGKNMRCSCVSREDLREILEPDKQQY